MASADQITALIRAHVDGNNDFFKTIALQIAAGYEGKSERTAKSIRMLMDREPRTMQAVQLPSTAANLLIQRQSATTLDDMVLASSVRERIGRLLLEHDKRQELAAHNLRPARKLLFVGPPGVGKTMMASALAHELGMPLMLVQLHAIITQYLGETAAKLRQVFDSIKVFKGVYMFDEFDALAAERGNTHDVAEMRRVVNSLLQFIEADDSDSVIIAATNHDDMIDRAMFRRFDDRITFPLPTPELVEQLARDTLLTVLDLRWNEIRTAASGVSHADLVAACTQVNKDFVIRGLDMIDTTHVVSAIIARTRLHPSVSLSV